MKKYSLGWNFIHVLFDNLLFKSYLFSKKSCTLAAMSGNGKKLSNVLRLLKRWVSTFQNSVLYTFSKTKYYNQK